MRNNHPHRNWKRRLNAAADQWLTSQEANLLSMPIATQQAIRLRIRLAYLCGLRDGEGREIDIVTLDRAEAEDERQSDHQHLSAFPDVPG